MPRRPVNPERPSPTVEDAVRRVAYEHVRAHRPGLMETVRRLVDAGQTPRQIERHVEAMGPEHHGAARTCYYAALHLLTNPSEGPA